MYFRLLCALLFPLCLLGQTTSVDTFPADSTIIVKSNPIKGFHHDYILWIPKETEKNTYTYLLVEPNNTGRPSDSMEVHFEYAKDLASVNSIGHNISKILKIPILVPIFPRPSSDSLVYTHALDRDVMLMEIESLKRLDLQLIAMIKDARELLKEQRIETHEKIFMNGFSASATFTNRFSMIHPDMIQAQAIGGFNGKLMLPLKDYKHQKLNYPLGIADFKDLFHYDFDGASYNTIPKYIYMGRLDTNDAVDYSDAYNDEERMIINTLLSETIYDRFLECQRIYKEKNVVAVFTTYEDVGHWTTTAMNWDIINFFASHLSSK